MASVEFFDSAPFVESRMWRAEVASVVRYCLGRGLDPGAGTRTLRPDTVRVDLFPEYQPHHVAQATALPFKADSFDYVFNAHLLEHLPDPRAAICEWLRVVKPGGCVAMVIPDTRWTRSMNSDRTPHLFEWDPEIFQRTVLDWPDADAPWFLRVGPVGWTDADVVSFGEAMRGWSFHVVMRKGGAVAWDEC